MANSASRAPRSPRARAQDHRRQARADGCAGRAWHPPNGVPAQTETGVRSVARAATTRAPAALGKALQAERKEASEDELDHHVGVASEGTVGRRIVAVDGARPVLAGRLSSLSQEVPAAPRVVDADETSWSQRNERSSVV